MLAAGSPTNPNMQGGGGGSVDEHPNASTAQPANAQTRAASRLWITSRSAWAAAQAEPADSRAARRGTTTSRRPPARPGGLWTNASATSTEGERRPAGKLAKEVPAA